MGQLDAVTVLPTAAAWQLQVNGTLTFWLEAWMVSAPLAPGGVTYSIVAVPLPPPTTTPTPSTLMTAVNTPLPLPGTVIYLDLNAPMYYVGLATGTSMLFSVYVGPSAAPNGLVFQLQSAPGNNVDLFVSRNAPNGATFMYDVAGLQSTIFTAGEHVLLRRHCSATVWGGTACTSAGAERRAPQP